MLSTLCFAGTATRLDATSIYRMCLQLLSRRTGKIICCCRSTRQRLEELVIKNATHCSGNQAFGKVDSLLAAGRFKNFWAQFRSNSSLRNATDSRINNATAVLRGLLYLLVTQKPSLVSHIRKKHDQAGKALFEDANAWVALSDIFTNVLQDLSLNSTSLVINALDECVADLPKLLDFIVQKSFLSSRVKWIVSSRNWPDIEERLERAGHKVKLCLKLNVESISIAVSIFIQNKVNQLVEKKKYEDKMRDAVLDHLSLHANDTFLWVALVCQTLENTPCQRTLAKLKALPPGLDFLYEQMMQQIRNLDDVEDVDLCKRILAVIAIVYQPIILQELTSLAFNDIFPSGTEDAHYEIFSRSLQVMSKTLRRDMYGLRKWGYPIERVTPPDPDPLAASRYQCIYWIDHLCDWNLSSPAKHTVDLHDGGTVDSFLRQQYLYWLEALSLCKSMSTGVVLMLKLEGRAGTLELIKLVKDARRFIMSHKLLIEETPLQAYASALLFSPTQSLIRSLFKREEPNWITIKPPMKDGWDFCLSTLEGHSGNVSSVAFSHDSAWVASGHGGSINSVAFSHDSARVASASNDNTVKIWNRHSGECLSTLEGHSELVHSVAFSHNSAWLVSASYDKTLKVWDAQDGECLHTLKGHSESINSVAFSHDSARVASASNDNTVKIWNRHSGECLSTLEGHSGGVNSVVFSHDSAWLVSASYDQTLKVWDAQDGECLHTLKGHSESINSVAFSHDSARVASASSDNTVKIWNRHSGECLSTLEGHSGGVNSVVFSHDSAQVASASWDKTVKIWDANSSECLSTREEHSNMVISVAFSYDSARLVSASSDGTVKIWNAHSCECIHTLKGHSKPVGYVAISPDSARLVSVSSDGAVKIWDARSGECLSTLEDHSGSVYCFAFSHDSARFATALNDRTVKIWDAYSGECMSTLKGHTKSVHLVAFSHDSAWVASASRDNTVKTWNAHSGECLSTLEGHSSVSNLAISPNST
ncbi:WD40-repeat-containing domain protein [Clohesyomyces aquaticus]|uniref:Mitochondrial division protein 1 n=1 Tax=Clohesyomyces aquaticus TaxID=1231657 RepID=A0A1Y1YJF4_9PLEO|nr:WD40-repeat-containing domain protein [Clohesyomyces aquaticus]